MTVEEMRRRKQELGLSYAQIAQYAGLPRGTVQKVLGGFTKSPRYSTLAALERCLSENAACEKQMIREGAPLYGGRQQGQYTLKDYLALPEERRAELIDGVLYDMAAPAIVHQLITGCVYAELLRYQREQYGSCTPMIAPVDVQLDGDDRTIVQPDILVLCDPSKRTQLRIVGAPDLIIEVLSPGTREKDLYLKLSKYRNAGVREYWIIDPGLRRVIVYDFQHEDLIRLYTFRDQIPVGISEGNCVIDFAGIDDYIQPYLG